MNRTVERRGLRAIGQLCNGTLSTREGEWLADQMQKDPAVCELYVDFMSMHACLASEATALKLATNSLPRLAATNNSPGELRSPRRFSQSWLVLAASLSAVALFTSWAGMRWLDREHGPQQDVAGRHEVPHQAAIARVTGTQNCRWEGTGSEVGYGSVLLPGQIVRLKEGIAEFTLEDGATMLLESPATVVFHAADDIEMRAGRMAAKVPAGAGHFCVHTQTLELSNTEAEFGLLARETGVSELHVFNGKVQAEVRNSAGANRRWIEVRASEAVLANPAETTIQEFPADQTYFVRSMSPVPGPHDGLLAYEGFVYPEGPLSAQNGGFGWAGPWFTIATDASAGPDSNSVRSRGLAMEGIVPRGNHAAILAQQNRIRRSLASSIGGVFDAAGLVEDQNGVRLIGQNGTTVYLSFLQRVDKIDDGFYGLELHRGDGNANRVLCIGNGADDTKYGVTSAVNVYGARNFPSLGEENADVNLFVVKIAYGADNRDTVEVFRNPESLDDENVCRADVVLKGNFAFDRISLANYDGAKIHEVDELLIGTHFLAVTGRWGGERGRLLRRITQADSLGDLELVAGRNTFFSRLLAGTYRKITPRGRVVY